MVAGSVVGDGAPLVLVVNLFVTETFEFPALDGVADVLWNITHQLLFLLLRALFPRALAPLVVLLCLCSSRGLDTDDAEVR